MLFNYFIVSSRQEHICSLVQQATVQIGSSIVTGDRFCLSLNSGLDTTRVF